MKRLVSYDDDEDDAVSLAIAPSLPSKETQVEQQIIHMDLQPRTAQAIAIEEQSFSQAYQKAERSKFGTLLSLSNQNVSHSPTLSTNLGDARKDGPWAPILEEQEEIEQDRKAWAEELERRRLREEKKKHKIYREETPELDTAGNEREIALPNPNFGRPETSERHGVNRVDYQGRTFVDPRRWPAPLTYVSEDDDEEDVELSLKSQEYLEMQNKKPKRRFTKLPSQVSGPATRQFIGHTMGVNKVRALGCLALTAGMDGSVMIWDISMNDLSSAVSANMADDRGAIQTYWGHDSRSVKDCTFRNTPDQFASCGFDGFTCLWDTETGKLIRKFHGENAQGSVNAVRFKPNDDSQLLIACSDRRLRHWDIREAQEKPAQVYDFHQSAVNSATFCEFGNKFISTGDDRKLLVWDWGVPSPVKIISEVWLPSMPTTATHPNSMMFVAIGLDNKIYQYRLNSNTGVVKKAGDFTPKDFRINGHACEPAFTVCGRYLACGDGTGSITIVRSRSSAKNDNKSEHRITHAHSVNTPVTCVQFHPCYEGILLSVGWDGKMNWWK